MPALPWPSTTRPSIHVTKEGTRVGDRQHIEKDKVAQTGWAEVFGEISSWGAAPTVLCPWLHSPGLRHNQQHSSSLPSLLLPPNLPNQGQPPSSAPFTSGRSSAMSDAEAESLARPGSLSQLGLRDHRQVLFAVPCSRETLTLSPGLPMDS